MTSLYTPAYFASGLFDQNYDILAELIIAGYRPRTAIDVGCGPGMLSQALARRGIVVAALDGHGRPDFTGLTATFRPCDLNSLESLHQVSRGLPGPFDVAICLEVAEHLEPEMSDELIAFLCGLAPVVVFSAAVPLQGGNGHINCQPREAWHDRFVRHGYRLAHRLRPQLQGDRSIAPWYRYNLLDYVKAPVPPTDADALARSMLLCESTLASDCYAQGDELNRLRTLLNYKPVRAYLGLRAWAKRLLRR